MEVHRNFREQFFGTDILLTEAEEEAVEENLVDCLDIFGTHRMDFGMNTDFKEVELSRNEMNYVDNRNLHKTAPPAKRPIC